MLKVVYVFFSYFAMLANLLRRIYPIWSFGILLWEIFSLGASPYPWLMADNMLSSLKCGCRNTKPELASDRLYQIMLDCWAELPEDRPIFADLLTRLALEKDAEAAEGTAKQTEHGGQERNVLYDHGDTKTENAMRMNGYEEAHPGDSKVAQLIVNKILDGGCSQSASQELDICLYVNEVKSASESVIASLPVLPSQHAATHSCTDAKPE
ncbi:unnamed protein product, partial [Protopolystoma xenopodis]